MYRHFLIAGRILRRQRPDPRNCPEPGATGRSAFELARLVLHIEKNFTDEVFRNLFVKQEPKPKAKHPTCCRPGSTCRGAGRLERSERSGRRPKPHVHSMAVLQGWSD